MSYLHADRTLILSLEEKFFQVDANKGCRDVYQRVVQFKEQQVLKAA